MILMMAQARGDSVMVGPDTYDYFSYNILTFALFTKKLLQEVIFPWMITLPIPCITH